MIMIIFFYSPRFRQQDMPLNGTAYLLQEDKKCFKLDKDQGTDLLKASVP